MYKAIVSKIVVRPHPNADRIQLATCYGNQVVVGLQAKTGDIGLFFRTDGQLSKEFAEANDLIRRKDPITGEHAGGFFDENRRVRSQKFRGEPSDGFWCPLSYLDFTGGDTSKLSPGDELDIFNGFPICNKYVTAATLAATNKQCNHRCETIMFPMHVETDQARGNLDNLPTDSLITITEKVHGTSHRFGYVLDEIPFTRWEKFLNRFRRKEPRKGWMYMSGSRKVIIRSDTKGYYDDESFRDIACQPFVGNLYKGEVVFFEIAGYTTDNNTIMAPQQASKLDELKCCYPEKMIFSYGCKPGECRIFVYRMIMVNEQGVITEYPWYKVRQRCKEIGVETVPVFMPTTTTFPGLQATVETLVHGPSTLDANHIREGVVVRVDNENGTRFYKHKSFEFGILEGYLKDNQNFVDIEEVS